MIKKDVLDFDFIVKNVRRVVPHIVEHALINDVDFLDEVNTLLRLYNPSLLNKTKEYKMEFFNSHISNGSRGYILSLVVVKHLYNKLVENSEYYLDEYWKKIIKEKFERHLNWF